MRVIIAGSRSITDYQFVVNAIRNSGFEIAEVISGGAAGVDAIGEQWAAKADVPVKKFPAEWDKYGRNAGPIRNSKMIAVADALIAVWDGKSRGTADIVAKAKACGLKVHLAQ